MNWNCNRRPEIEPLFKRLDSLEQMNSQLEAIDEAIGIFAAIIARLREASRAATSSKANPTTRGGRRITQATASLYAVVAKSPDLSTRELCGRLDLAEQRIPESWAQKEGVRDWVSACDHPELKASVHTMISKARAATRRN